MLLMEMTDEGHACTHKQRCEGQSAFHLREAIELEDQRNRLKEYCARCCLTDQPFMPTEMRKEACAYET